MNKKSRLRLTSWLLAVVMAISIASPALAADASVVSESTPAAVSESTPDNSVPESIPAQGNDVPTSTDPPEENQGAADSSSEPKSESTPESENIPDSTSASDSESTPDSSSVPESESMSDSDSASGSESTPDSESDSLSESTSSTESGSETPAFTPLGIAEMFTHAEAQPGDTVELYVRLNRDDVAATYQWQVLDASPGEIESPEAMYPYGEGESTDYAFLLDGMTEEELLAINPDAVWPGIEMYYAKKGKQARQRTLSSEPIHIENGTPNYVLNPEAQDIEDTEIAWRDIDGATDSTYPHVVTGDEEDLSYRCVITVTDEAYLTEAAQTETESGTAEAVMEEAAPESAAEAVPDASASDARAQVQAMAAPVKEAVAGETLISDSMYVDIPAMPAEDAPALFSVVTGSAQDVHLSEDNQWLIGLTQHMEYITAQAYQEYGGEAANNPYWTKISGGARADGSKYVETLLIDNNQMEVLSAWYGRAVYVRVQGESGPGKAIEIPAYTGVDYQTGAKTLYKSAVKIFNAWVPDTGMSFYNAFLRTALNDGWTDNGTHITVDTAPIDSFNRIPTNYLTNAEGDYIYDLVIVGASAYNEPDISGAAAWALADYIGEGYGFLIGHDMMYGYAGVNPNPYYEPDPNDTTTPYYVQNSKENGHWNLNWLMGVNKLYTEASPYDAASMILNIGDFNDKSTMYGDDSGSSTLRIKKKLEGDPATNVAARCPTNWPYTQAHDGVDFNVGDTVPGTATHTNQQMAFGTVWIDYASNSITGIGGGKLLETTVDGVYGTNNFYLTTNGNFGMSQIGHKSENINLAKLDECYLLANTVMYLSQRQQCQVCQSEQGGNREIHFVHRISSARSSNAGETLTPDGTAQENAENKLLEYKITRTGEISLDNNPYGDYEIKAEQYSGAIRRRTISAFVGNLTARYGDGVAEEPTAAAEYSAAEGGSGTQLQISALVADDTLTLDADKSGFEYAPITAETEAGYYPLEYVGLTEENYPVLRNYIIWYEPGSIAVTPRPLVISAGEYSMIYGDPLPEFAPAYNGFINGDTPDSDLQGEPVFVTDATSTSDVGRYPVELSGLTRPTPMPTARDIMWCISSPARWTSTAGPLLLSLILTQTPIPPLCRSCGA
ncbi:MBG domain-containing protein [Ruthenibacterium lactatiformans]|uniref:MBG domain-containing protein n=1 Tax=Ruthenibacterium lactatiformans TaxID=1550024 RepID=UPI0010648DF9|nr:MBG domain-containing protein [Ruthenibacterium lactatiformans]